MTNKEQATKWIGDYFPNHGLYKCDDYLAAMTDDYTEVFLYEPLITDALHIKIVNVEIVPEIIFISRLPETEVEFIQLMHLVGF